MSDEQRVRIGTASWTDSTLVEEGDWYPRRSMSADERLRFYASVFPVVEVDATYYYPPTQALAGLWTRHRHALGEYYTPDWLAKALVDEVVDDPLRQRVLDGGCGSGTFLFCAVQRCLEACETTGMTTAESITGVTSRVFGIDIHPVAVALARVTYLLAITTAHPQGDRPRFAMSVWLGDSVQYQRRDTLHDVDALTIHTSDGMEPTGWTSTRAWRYACCVHR